MAKETVTIACRLPMGMVIFHPVNRSVKVKLDGPRILVAEGHKIGPSFVTTQVDAELWASWKAAYASSELLTKGLIFEAKSEAEAAAKAREYAKERTGFEQIPQAAMGVSKAVA